MLQSRHDTRKYHYCPFKTCTRAVKKLSQHLRYKHPNLSEKQRKDICGKAKLAEGRGARKTITTPQQATLYGLIDGKKKAEEEAEKEMVEVKGLIDQSEDELMEEDGGSSSVEETCARQVQEGDVVVTGQEGEHSDQEEVVGGEEGSRREALPAYAENLPFLQSLRDFLTSKHGRGRSVGESRQISAEVSRFLFFAQPEELREALLLDIPCLDAYFKMLEEREVTYATLAAKISRLSAGIEFYAMAAKPVELPHIERVKGILKNWRIVYSRDAKRENRERLEDLSEAPPSLECVNEFIQCQDLHSLAKNIFSLAKGNKDVKGQDIRTVILWLAGSLLLTNHQRPGAIVNAKIEEYMAAKEVKVGRDTYKTFYVKQHKTGTTGRAKITANKQLSALLDSYVEVIRPLLGDSSLLFPNREGDPIDHLSRHVKKLGEKYGIEVPTATASRRAAATAVSTEMGLQEREAVAAMMSHSVATQQRYYAQTKGREQAVRGFQVMEELREGKTAGGHKVMRFSEEETETLRLYFESNILNQSIPPISECREFLKNHPMNKDAKQVRDKVRSIVRSEKR